MPVIRSNRLLPLLAGAVILMFAFVTVKSCNNEKDASFTMDSVPQAPAPDADSPADTIKTLTANVAAMTVEVQALRKDNDTLHGENRDLLANRQQIEENVATRVKAELMTRQKEAAASHRIESGVLSSLTSRVDALSQSLTQIRSADRGSDIPVGLGLDDLAGSTKANELVWIDPLDVAKGAETSSQSTRILRHKSQAAGQVLASIGDETNDLAGSLKTDRPIFTVPRNATLIGSTAMTALVGRIPVQGQVRDPMPFKVITGSENLAANGLTVPGVQGMIWSGTAIGDWTLACVTGRLDSVTFVFDDGTIRTISSDDQDRQNGGEDRPLGWISDDQGIPCITGERKTNAPAFLTQRIGVTAIQAAAEAAASAQTTSRVSDVGTVTNAVTGDSNRFVMGKTLSGASDAVSKWLLERQAQSFDAVFVPAGVQIAIHVDHELPIDLEHNGRKLSHAHANDSTLRTRLD